MPHDRRSDILVSHPVSRLRIAINAGASNGVRLREGIKRPFPTSEELAPPTNIVAHAVGEPVVGTIGNLNPSSSRVRWWPLAFALLAIPAALAKRKREVPDQARYSDMPEPPKDSAKGFVKDIVVDQKRIWTSPLRMTCQNAKWWVLFGAATGALLATDRRSAQQLPNTKDQLAVSRHVSQLGAEYSLIPIASGLYLSGVLSGQSKLRETGFLGAEALVDALAVSQVLKATTGRQRPLEGDGGGHFFHGGDGFPSGHTIESFALASVIAHQYHDKKTVVVLAYGLATAIAASRFTARQHFASDVVAGGAMGWFLGRYVSERRREDGISPAKTWLMPKVIPQLRSPHRHGAAETRRDDHGGEWAAAGRGLRDAGDETQTSVEMV